MSASIRQFYKPYMIHGNLSEGRATGLRQMSLTAKKNQDGMHLYNEGWIQELIHKHPDLLPVRELEPAFHPIFPVCRELPTKAGDLDNLFVSENGSLVLVECKLWKNPQARREVIGQALDYAKEISRWTYEDLVEAVSKRTKSQEDGVLKAVQEGRGDKTEEFDEKTFIDSVSRNLRRGRFLLLIVGDGIHEGVEGITNFLQRHAGLDFTFGLVELSVFKVEGREEFLIQPRILANSVTVVRGVVRVEEQRRISVDSPVEATAGTGAQSSGAKVTISEQEFYEKFTASSDVATANALRLFLDKLASIEVTPFFGVSSLNLRWFPASDKKMNFGSIKLDGKIDTDVANWVCGSVGRLDLGEKYQHDIADLIKADVRKSVGPAVTTIKVVQNGSQVHVKELLGVAEKWFDVICELQVQLAQVVRDYGED